MADEANEIETDNDALSDEELESIAGGQGGKTAKRPEAGRLTEPEA